MTMPAGWKTSKEREILGSEETIWRNEITHGIFKKTVVEVQTLTNYRVLRNGYETMLEDIDDVIVMNQHRVSQSDHMGTYYGRYARFGMGSSKSRSRTVGDIVFMRQGRQDIVFSQVVDPHGVARLAKAAKKAIIQALKAEERKEKQLQKERTVVVVNKPLKKNLVREQALPVCLQCNRENPHGSKFCSYCGSKFQRACIQCGKTNPENSSFCNQCGFALA